MRGREYESDAPSAALSEQFHWEGNAWIAFSFCRQEDEPDTRIRNTASGGGDYVRRGGDLPDGRPSPLIKEPGGFLGNIQAVAAGFPRTLCHTYESHAGMILLFVVEEEYPYR